MHVNFRVTTSEEYFSLQEKEIDWDGNDNTKVSLAQEEELVKILATESAIFLMRRATGIDGGLIDPMAAMRRELIDKYEAAYEPYVEYNDFW